MNDKFLSDNFNAIDANEPGKKISLPTQAKIMSFFEEMYCSTESLEITHEPNRAIIQATLYPAPRDGIINEAGIKHNGRAFSDVSCESNYGQAEAYNLIQIENSLGVIEEYISLGEYCDDECDATISINITFFAEADPRQSAKSAEQFFEEKQNQYMSSQLNRLTEQLTQRIINAQADSVKQTIKAIYAAAGAEVFEEAMLEIAPGPSLT